MRKLYTAVSKGALVKIAGSSLALRITMLALAGLALYVGIISGHGTPSSWWKLLASVAAGAVGGVVARVASVALLSGRLRRLAKQVALLSTSKPSRQAAVFTSTVGCADFAGRMVVKRHPHLREAWLGDLRRDADDRPPLTTWRALRVALGYLCGAVRIRIQDTVMARSAYRAANYILSSRPRTRAVINVVLGIVMIRVYADQGFDGWLADVVSFSIAWTALDRFAEWLRTKWFPGAVTHQQDTGADKPPA